MGREAERSRERLPRTLSLCDGLRGYNIADGRIHAEVFGPSSLVRKPDVVMAAPLRWPRATTPVAVASTASRKQARWTPESGTLLELAETRGLSPAFSCREGSCGTCRTRLLAGAVTYVKEPIAEVADDQVLICRAVPAKPPADGKNWIRLVL